MEYLFIAIIGACMGSFVGALTWRLYKSMDFVSDRSICEHCEHVLSWQDLIPLVSWLSLGGRCRYCQKSIGVMAICLELAGLALFVVSFWAWPVALTGVAAYALFGLWLAIVVVLLALFVYDLRWMLLPNTLVAPLALLVFAYRVVEVAVGDLQLAESMKSASLGLLVGGGMFYVLFQVSSGRWIGGGDVKLGFVMGALLGPSKALVGLLVGFYAAALIILPLMAIGRVSRSTKIPFGPFLIAGFVIAFFWGADIRETYLNLSGY